MNVYQIKVDFFLYSQNKKDDSNKSRSKSEKFDPYAPIKKNEDPQKKRPHKSESQMAQA